MQERGASGVDMAHCLCGGGCVHAHMDYVDIKFYVHILDYYFKLLLTGANW